MKKVLLLIFILSISLNSQTQIDSVISINLPKGYKKIVSNTDLKNNINEEFEYYTYNIPDSDFYYFSRNSYVSKNGEEKSFVSKNIDQLNRRYSNYSKSLIESFKEKGFDFSDSTKIKYGDFVGLKLIFRDSLSKTIVGEANILELNGVRYTTSYTKTKTSIFNVKKKNDFLSSFKINNPENQTQIQRIKSYANHFSIFYYICLTLIGVFIFRKKINLNNKWIFPIEAVLIIFVLGALLSNIKNMDLPISIISGFTSYILFKHFKKWRLNKLKLTNSSTLPPFALYRAVQIISVPIMLALVSIAYFLKSF